MTLRELVTCIVWSSPGDWNKIRGHPSYRDKFTLHETGGGDRFGFQSSIPTRSLRTNPIFRSRWHGDWTLTRIFKSRGHSSFQILTHRAITSMCSTTEHSSSESSTSALTADHLTWSMPSRPPDYFERAGLQIINTPWPEEAPIEHDGIRGLDLRATGEGTGPTR